MSSNLVCEEGESLSSYSPWQSLSLFMRFCRGHVDIDIWWLMFFFLQKGPVIQSLVFPLLLICLCCWTISRVAGDLKCWAWVYWLPKKGLGLQWWLKLCQLSWVSKIQIYFSNWFLTMRSDWFWQWFGAKQVTSHYLNQWWPNLLMHICFARPQWVNLNSSTL